VSAREGYLAELGGALRVRGRARRRFLRECADHLADAAAVHGGEDAVRAFGPATEVAAAFDAEVAARRGARATVAAIAAVLATGGSALAVLHGAAPGAVAPTAWAVVFFVAAQVAAVAAALALLQALATRRAEASGADVLLLARRNACALLAAALTLLAAGAGLPGHGAAAAILAGPLLVFVALGAVARSRALARRLEGAAGRPVRPPLDDLAALAGRRAPALGAGRQLAIVTGVAVAAALLRGHAEHVAVGAALRFAAVEAVAVLACFAVLGRALGLRGPRA
jgi:hypothetical protein